jgi:hypothetical protein
MDAILDTIPRTVQPLFSTTAGQLARQTGFVKRLRSLTPAALARTLSVFLIREPNASLAQLARELDISASALCQRLSDPAAAAFLHAVLRAAITQLAATPAPRIGIPLLHRFNGVYLTDATSLPLPPALADTFPGYGGGTHPGDPSATAAAKILLRWRLDTSRSAELLSDAATTPDLHLLKRLPELPPGALHIADLGFYDAEYLRALRERGVHWLTRLPTTICVGPERADQELADWLRSFDPATDRWEGELVVGKVTPLRARVMVQRCPPAIAAARRRKLHATASRKGRSVSARQLTLCDWWVLATDLPAETLRAHEAVELYRARWQIELVFKRWKSLGHLAVPRQGDPQRALATLYGLLLGLLIVDWLAIQRGGALSGRSLWQAWQIVRRWLGTLELVLRGVLDWTFALESLAKVLDQRPYQPRRRKRPTTRQRLYRATLVT